MKDNPIQIDLGSKMKCVCEKTYWICSFSQEYSSCEISFKKAKKRKWQWCPKHKKHGRKHR